MVTHKQFSSEDGAYTDAQFQGDQTNKLSNGFRIMHNFSNHKSEGNLRNEKAMEYHGYST